MNFLFLRGWKRAVLKMRRLTLSLWCQYLLVLWAFPLLLQDVVFDLIPPTEKEQDTTDAICLEALFLAFHCDWLAHSGKKSCSAVCTGCTETFSMLDIFS